jgi:hypothetical protein
VPQSSEPAASAGSSGAGSEGAGPAEAEQPSRLEAQLRQHGFALVEDWQLDLDALRSQAFAAIRDGMSTSLGTARGDVHLPALNPLLRSESLARTLRGYLGGRVRYDGAMTLHLGPDTNQKNYQSATWHHDRCGRRIKLFIFLHDVRASGRPTLVAGGTHETWYYSHDHYESGRYRSEWIEPRHNVTPMLGPRGGGFIFDTNSLHRGEHRGTENRTVVCLEFHSHGKVRALRGAEAHVRRAWQSIGVGRPRSLDMHPCPSYTPMRHHGGVAGFPLYPIEWSGLSEEAAKQQERMRVMHGAEESN